MSGRIAKRHEYVVTPDSSPSTHYEIIRLTDVYAHYAGNQVASACCPSTLPRLTEPTRNRSFATRRAEESAA